MIILDILKDAGISGFLDIAFVSLLTYTVILWFKKTKSALVLVGIFIIGVVYASAYYFDLYLTTALFRNFFAVILVALVVIFQEELRYFFEQVAVMSLNRGTVNKDSAGKLQEETDILTRTLTDLSKERIGALVIIKGKNIIVRHLQGGHNLNGEISEPILKSIFDPNSMGHDGAVIIEKDRITQFGCHLPLSKDVNKTLKKGTRHAAALGLSELTDALCIVVSEEKGTISVVRNGMIDELANPGELSMYIQKFFKEIMPSSEKRPITYFFKRNILEKVIAVVITITLWILVAQESKITTKSFTVPIQHSTLPDGLEITNIIPDETEVTLSGSRRDFYLVNEKKIDLVLKIVNPKPSIYKRKILDEEVSFPDNIALESVSPRTVKIAIVRIKEDNDDKAKEKK